MTRSAGLAAVLGAALAASPGIAAASVEAVAFEGIFTHGHWLLGGSDSLPPSWWFVTLGETRFSGRFVLDLAAEDTDDDPFYGVYPMEGAAVRLELEIGTIGYRSGAILVEVHDDTVHLGGYDGQVVSATDVASSGIAPFARSLSVVFGSGLATTAIGADTLVPGIVLRDAFPVRFLSIRSCADGSDPDPFACTSFEGISGEIDVVELVPEAAGIASNAAAGAGLGLAAARRRRRRRHALAARGAEP
jgi:hypothetical protein